MIRFKRTIWLAALAASLLGFISNGAAQTGPVTLSSMAPVGSYPSQVAAGVESRYAVTHAHIATQCVGYLYVSATRVRYEVVQPDTDKRHSFDFSRSEIMWVQQWMLLGMPQNAVELRTARGNYHFWLLPESADLARTSARQWGIGSAIPVATLLTALQGPNAAVPDSGVPAAPLGANTGSTYPGAYSTYPAPSTNVPTPMPNVAVTGTTPGSAYPSAYPNYPTYPTYPTAGATTPATPMPSAAIPNVTNTPAPAPTYPAAYPTYPTYPQVSATVPAPPMPGMSAPNAATSGSTYPGVYPTYPAANVTSVPVPPMPEMAVPNAAAPVSTYPAAYRATPMPNITAPTAGIPYPESTPVYPASTPGAASIPAPPMPGIATPTPALPGSSYPGTYAPGYPAYPAAPVSGTPSTMAMPNVVGPNSLAEYVYAAPQGWTTTPYPDGIVLRPSASNNGEPCLITMWPMRPAGVDLPRDADIAFQTIYSSYELRDRSSDGMPVPQTMIRGTSGQGWDYVMLKKAIGKPSNPPGQWETLLGFVMVAKLDGNLAVISGLSKLPLVSTCFGELTPSLWPRFFYSLRFRSWPGRDQTSAMAAKLAGVWTSATGNAADRYEFNANGRYGTAAAVQNYNRISSMEVLRTTQAFFGNGSYSLRENTITFSPDDGGGLPENGWFRLEYESHDGRSWSEVLYLLKRSVVDGSDYEVRYSKRM